MNKPSAVSVISKILRSGTIVQLISHLLLLLWVYASLSKLIEFNRSKREILNQPLAPWLEEILVWAVPLIELLTAMFLLFKRTRIAGILLSALLLFTFSIYIIVIKLNYFGFIPCSCGGILRSLNWTQHLLFNSFFLILSLVALVIDLKERRSMK